MSLRINDTANFTAKPPMARSIFINGSGGQIGRFVFRIQPRRSARRSSATWPDRVGFTKRNPAHRPLGDPVSDHSKWAADIRRNPGASVKYPMIGDTDLAVAKTYNMLPAEEPGTSEGRTAATNATVRSVFIIGPDKKVKLMLTYPMTTGRNFDEILRVLDSMQLTAKHKVATPVNWKNGEDVIIAGSVSDADAKTLFPDGWNAPKPYLRIVKQPA